ncbi:Uncharacterised protein [Candidatus Tiddalikarchaeum anstoanum]|nr:Uncharacterised protein [Candidatus Tiddalikarchaeum anstoanum]
MVLRRLLIESKDSVCIRDALIFDTPEKIKPLVSKLAWRILTALREKPLYPLQIAKKLEVHEQKVYYHINRLFRAGLVKIVKSEEIKGADAKFYAPSNPVFGVDLGYGEYVSKKNSVQIKPYVLDFFKEFNREEFDGQIVVGSPEAHGPLNTWAKDGHYSNYISFFLGSFINFSNKDFITLDINVKSKEKFNENFILIGGPGVNVMTLEFNKYLPITFDTKFGGAAPSASFGKGFISKKTNKVYTDENVGVVEKIKNPLDTEKSIIVCAGITKRGTMSAIIALTRYYNEVLKNYKYGEDFGCVVKGSDINGDGVIDTIELLE